MIAFSDHRLGASLLATPLQWLGASPLTAYNIVFLATFPLCANLINAARNDLIESRLEIRAPRDITNKFE